MKILWVSDSPDSPTGQGNQTRLILSHLYHLGHDVVSYGVYSHATTPYLFNNIRVHPTPNYDNLNALRFLINQERPDILVVFADPRFFTPIFTWLDEFREKTRVVFYHLWDNDPAPTFNLRLYHSFDAVIAASQATHNLLAQIPGFAVPLHCIPHATSPQEFYPLPEAELNSAKEELFQQAMKDDPDFVIFWNNRALPRKRPGDIIAAFAEFNTSMRAKGGRPLLMMHTRLPQDDSAAENVLEYRNQFPGTPLLLYSEWSSIEELNCYYNFADITCNFSFHEGFGMSVGESLMAGKPVVVSQTGGMPEQVTGANGSIFGEIVPPAVRMLHSTPGDNLPIIRSDIVSHTRMVAAFRHMYRLKLKGSLVPLGLRAREHMIATYAPELTAQKFSDVFTSLLNLPPRPLYRTAIF